MGYKFYEKPFSELTREELHSMIRTNKNRIPIDNMLEFYRIDPIEYFEGIKSRGLAPLRYERERCAEARNLQREKERYSDIVGIDLMAMRIFRGYSRHKFARMVRLTVEKVKSFERSSGKVPERIAELYTETLSIQPSHLIQLRDIYKGKSKTMTDDREIPKPIKLRVFRRDKGKCTRCEKKNNLHYHHIKRYSDGGQHTENNIILLCASCHAEEHKGEQAYHMLKKMAEG